MTAASRGLYARSRGSKPVRQFISDYEVPTGIAPPPESSYFLDLYGTCQRRPDECLCLATTEHPNRVWRGRECPHWAPRGATSVDGLIAAARDGRRA